MDWIFYDRNKKYYASFTNGVFESDHPFVKFAVWDMIDNSVSVRPGHLSPPRPASLSSDELAWATISKAIRIVSADTRNKFPLIDAGIEPKQDADS